VVSEGMLLMGVGMATVFAFLGLLVGLMQGSAAFFAAFADRFPEPEAAAHEWANSPIAGNDEVIAIVLASVEAHRQGRNGGGA